MLPDLSYSKEAQKCGGYMCVCVYMHVQVHVWVFSILTQNTLYFLNSEQTIINMPVYNLWSVDFIFIAIICSLVSPNHLYYVYLPVCLRVTFTKASTGVFYSFTTPSYGGIPGLRPASGTQPELNKHFE